MMTDRSATSRRLLYILFAAQSMVSAAQIAIFTLIAIIATRMVGTENVAGLPSTTLTFSQAFTAFPIAIIMGRFGRRIGLSLGYGIGALSGLIGVIAIMQGSFLLLLLSAALFGISRASGDQSRFAVGEMFRLDERARMIGRLIFAGTVGAIVGPALVAPSGRVMESLGLNADLGPWAGAFVLYGLASLITLFFLRPDPMTIAKEIASDEALEHPDEKIKAARPVRQLLGMPTVQLAVLAMLISQTVMVVLMVMTPLHMDHLHHSRESISLVIAAHTLGMFGLAPLTGYLIDRIGRIPMLIMAALTLIAAALLAPLSGSEYVLAAALFLLGLGWNFGYVSGTSLLADALEGTERARMQGVNDALVSFVAGFASLSAGPLFATGGYQAVSLAGIALTGTMIALVFWLTRPQLKVKTV